jgi:hypothetical protein
MILFQFVAKVAKAVGSHYITNIYFFLYWFIISIHSYSNNIIFTFLLQAMKVKRWRLAVVGSLAVDWRAFHILQEHFDSQQQHSHGGVQFILQ